MIQITNIRINYLREPIGVERIDQIGWQIISDLRDVVQSSYRLQIAEEEMFAYPIYDSGWVVSSKSAQVTLSETLIPLCSLTKYYIRVQITTTQGEQSEWCKSSFVTALLSNGEWCGHFITIESENEKAQTRSSYLKKSFPVEKAVKNAYLLSTALGIYHVYLNGVKVGEDQFAPGWTSYNKHLLYQIYDVTDSLWLGDNVITGFINAGWYKGKMGPSNLRNHYGSRAAFACQLHIQYTDGSCALWKTDDSWQGAWGPVTFSEFYDGEIYDARLELSDWGRKENSTDGWQSVDKVVFDHSALVAQSGGKIRCMEKLPVGQVLTTPGGDTVLDFGQNLTGYVEIKVCGEKGARVILKCFEVLDSAGNVYLDNLRSAKQTVTYICKDNSDIVYHPYFSFQGFRYVKIEEYPGEIQGNNFTAWIIHSNMSDNGTFECSNPDINQLHHNILWGMKGNFLDIPTDCPQRDERLGWTGDAQIFCRTACYLMDTYTFFSKWLRDLAADQTPEGGVPHVVPDILIGKTDDDPFMKDGAHSAAAWADAAVIIPWTLYLTYGDKTILEQQYDSMKAWIHFMRDHATNGIWNYKLQYGDWVALDAEEGSYFGATPNDLTCTAFYAYSTGLFAKIAATLDKKDNAAYYNALYKQIVSTYRETFFDKNGHLTAQTQTAQIVTLYFGLAAEEHRQNVVDDLLRLLKKENGHLVTGFVGTPYFCHALSQNGHVKEAYGLLLKEDFPSWLYQVKQGATTIWEHWDGIKPDGSMWSPDMNSFNHYAYGAVGEWLYRVVAGIECDEKQPGFRHVIIAPRIGGGLNWVKASYQSLYGKIATQWSQRGSTVVLRIDIPCNTTATVRLYDALSVQEADGLSFAEGADELSANCGSGSYQITYTLAQ